MRPKIAVTSLPAHLLKRLVCSFFLCMTALFLYADEAALADAYYNYLFEAIAGKGPEAAESYLLRARDYAGVSSDLSFELARVQMALSRPRNQILSVLGRAIMTNRWKHGSENEARLYAGELLNGLRQYNKTLTELAGLPQSLRKEQLYLAALWGTGNAQAFRTRMDTALALYPADEGIIKIGCRYLSRIHAPEPEDIRLANLLVRRVTGRDGLKEALYLVAPFIDDTESARILLLNWYLEQSGNVPAAALDILLQLGVIDENEAANALFTPRIAGQELIIDKDVITKVFFGLRTDAARDYFLGKLTSFTGAITADNDGDGIAETRALYQRGLLVNAVYDGAQERIDRLVLKCKAGEPVSAVFTETPSDEFAGFNPPPPRFINIEYDPYPAVNRSIAGDVICYFLPDSFYLTPARFESLCAVNGPLFPVFDGADRMLVERTLYNFAAMVERPSREFRGAVETVRLLNGIVISAVERLDGTIIAETEFLGGRPVLQRVDTGLDGRMETKRYFVRESGMADASYLTSGYPRIEYIEADWEGNGIYERE